jgi:hypothetical protein
LLANHRKTAAELIRQGSSDEKASGFDADQQVWLVGSERLGEAVNGGLPSLGMGEQGGNVVEEDTRLWEIRYRPNMLLEVHGCRPWQFGGDDPVAAIETEVVAA